MLTCIQILPIHFFLNYSHILQEFETLTILKSILATTMRPRTIIVISVRKRVSRKETWWNTLKIFISRIVLFICVGIVGQSLVRKICYTNMFPILIDQGNQIFPRQLRCIDYISCHFIYKYFSFILCCAIVNILWF